LSVYWRLGTFDPSMNPSNPTSPGSPVPWTETFRSLSASDHTCGLTTGGRMVCWGAENPRRRGIPSDHVYSDSPPAVGMGGIIFSSVMTGGNFTCALTSAGVTYCFGEEKSTD
jgi:alpha-tubulin suppressor-like RCC1 family protein